MYPPKKGYMVHSERKARDDEAMTLLHPDLSVLVDVDTRLCGFVAYAYTL